MTDAQLQEVKKEIRSLLISFQKGTSFSDFSKEYRSMIGRNLPFKDFNFKDAISFLYSMPDVVKIFNSSVPGDYHLFGVADKASAHIQKMVIRQKTTKHRPIYRIPRGPSNASSYAPPKSQYKAYSVPPRFAKKGLPAGVDKLVIDMLKYYQDGLTLNKFMETFCFHYHRQFTFKEWGYTTLEECLETIPGINARNKYNDIFVFLTTNLPKETKPKTESLLPTPVHNSMLKGNVDGQSAAKSLTSTLGQTNVPLKSTSSDYFDRDFNPTANTKSSNTSQSCIENSSNKSESFLLKRFVEDSQNHQFLQKNTRTEDEYFPEDASLNGKIIETTNQSNSIQGHSKVDTLDDFQLINYREETKSNPKSFNNFDVQSTPNFFETDNSFDTFSNSFTNIKSLDSFGTKPDDGIFVSENIKRNINKVMERYPQGIFAVRFKDCYEEVTNSAFDLHSLGFNNLSDFVDAVPDVLVRKPYIGSKKDWLIYSAKTSETELSSQIGSGGCSVLFVECVILNTRKILQAYSLEGIRLNEFIRLYSINCKEPLHIRDLGFDNLENFLLSIAPRVPLRITFEGDEKFVRIDSFEEIIKPPVSPVKKPMDVASPNEQFKTLQLPSNFDYTKYVPVFTSSIAHPGLLYIQLEGDEWSLALTTLYNEIEIFYTGELGDSYKLKPEDLKENIACVAFWPEDKHWYRAKVTKLVSRDTVQVFYSDYGTTDEIPVYMLRYIKSEYMQLPIQALKSRLAYLKPPYIPGQNILQWDKRTRIRMLELCSEKPLMAKIENIKNGVLALILCDTSGDDDIYINDVLANENLAELYIEEEDVQIHSPVFPPSTESLVALQYLSQLAQSTDFMRALQNLSVNSSEMPSCGLGQTLPIASPTPSLFPSTLQQSLNNSLINSSLNTAKSLITPIQPPVYPEQAQASAQFLAPSVPFLQNENDSPPGSPSPDEMDVFDDDDDDYFEKLCQEKNFLCTKTDKKKCFVKRVKTTDGYAFHVLLFENKPYVSCGDISVLIWSNKNPAHLFHRLQIQEVEISSKTVMETDNEEFFLQLKRFHVKGIETFSDSNSSILIYPLDKFNFLLNIFGHPSATLRSKVCSELVTFNPSATYWLESSDTELLEEIEEVHSVTDDDKLNRLCLYDLKTMKEGIRCKRLQLIKSQKGTSANSDLEDEINKLNLLFTKVRERIVEIEQVCKMFSDTKQ